MWEDIILKLKNIKVLILGVLTCGLLLTGCGDNAELANYKANMTQFFENVTIFDQQINSLDPNSDNAGSDLLAILDTMDKSFAQMAELPVPQDFPGVEELSDEASEYMTQAVALYHQAFEADPFDAATADIAKQNYDRANLRVQYILSILHGNIPEEIYTPVEGGNGIFSNPEDGETATTEETSTQE